MRSIRFGRFVLAFAIAIGVMAAACSSSSVPATPTSVPSALATVAAKAGFPLMVPTSFPTSADQLTQAESDPVTASLLHLTYASQDKSTVGGTPRATATLFITESSGKMVQPATSGGRLVSKDASGYQLREGPDAQSGVSSYNTTSNSLSLVMIFQGERPTDAGVEKSLASLEVVK